MKKLAKGILQRWGEKIDWDKRVHAVCKPCWELKYCPYGPVVERFPLLESSTHRTCRIFGHECPVFCIAEPLTETRALRNISRHIPRPVQFRVLKRENQVCRSCGLPVADDDIHFDHIIPWSKGGPTEENNIQLLCGACNRKKSDRFDEEFLITELMDHVSEPVDSSVVDFLLILARMRHDFFSANLRLPNAEDIASEYGDGQKGEPEELAEGVILDLEAELGGEKPKDVTKKNHESRRLRWGYKDTKVRKLRAVSVETGIAIDELLESEMELVEKLGWSVKNNAAERKKWLKK
jgi:hypothetical protein